MEHAYAKKESSRTINKHRASAPAAQHHSVRSVLIDGRIQAKLKVDGYPTMKAVALKSESVIGSARKRQKADVHSATGEPWFIRPPSTYIGPTVHRKSACACGGGCSACRSESELTVSQPTDPAEIEADQIADKVMRMQTDVPVNTHNLHTADPDKFHTKCDECDEEEDAIDTVHRKVKNVSADPSQKGSRSSVSNVVTSAGQPLDRETREFFEQRFGRDLGNVRVHFDAAAQLSARNFGAHAYTFGSDIVFGTNQFAPQSYEGRRLLAHELTHVMQQDQGVAAPVTSNREIGLKVPTSPLSGETVQRQSDPFGDPFDSPTGDQPIEGGGPGKDSENSKACPPVPTRLGDTVPDPQCAKATHIGTNELTRFNFCLDSDQMISPDQLDQLRSIVKHHPRKTRFLVHGYASPEGRTDYNFRLACHRATRIADALKPHIIAQVARRLSKADSERIKAETNAEIQNRIEIATQGPTSEFGAPEQNRVAVVFGQVPGREADEEPGCEDAPQQIGDITPEVNCDLPTKDLTVINGGPHFTHFHFCLDSDILAKAQPSEIRSFAQSQAAKSTFVIHGFSSEEGSADYNRRLSCHRALRIARELINAGVRPEQIREVSGMGETTLFGEADFNRVAAVLAEGGDVDPLKDRKRRATTRKEKLAIRDEAKQRLVSGQYSLAADDYISFWTCGRTSSVGQAVERLTIALPEGNKTERLRDQANGTEEGFGVNFVRLSNATLRADNSIECTMGRLIDMAFHHAVLQNPGLPRDLTRRFDLNARSESPVADPKNKEARHRAGLHLIHLAGLEGCSGRFAKPDDGGIAPVGIDSPLAKDPRANKRAPKCTEAPQPTRLHRPVKGSKEREAPEFRVDFNETKYSTATGKLTTNFDSDADEKSSILRTRPDKDMITATANVQLVGQPDVFADYEIGFIQTVLGDETQVEYDSGHAVIQGLPVPIRLAAMKDDVPVPAPWTTLNSMKRPDSEGKVVLTATGSGLSSEAAIKLRLLKRTLPNAALSEFERGTRIAIWLVARRIGAPLDRFSVHFLDGVQYDLTQITRLEHRRKKGDLGKPGFAGGEQEIPIFTGGFHSSKPSLLPADPSKARFGGPVGGEMNLSNQISKIIEPDAATRGDLGRAELAKVVANILDNLVLFETEEDAKSGTFGTKMPRLGFDFIPLTVTLPIVRRTGRLVNPDGPEIVVKVKGPGLGKSAGREIATALQFRIHARGFEHEDVVVRPSIVSGSAEVGVVTVSLPALPKKPDSPVEQESDLTKRPDVLNNMAEAWACTELTKTPEFIMVGEREFGRSYSMDREKVLSGHPSDRLAAGDEEKGGSFTTLLPCPKRSDGVVLGSFHTHPEVQIPPVPTKADLDFARKCGGAQYFIVTDNRVFRYFSDGTVKTVSVSLPKVDGCHKINLEDIIKVLKN